MAHCWLCGRNGTADPLDRHHIFGGAYRKKSEKYGLVVYLCHSECHIFGAKAAHRSRETADRLCRWGQAKAMRENGWTTERFMQEFGRNYILNESPEDAPFEWESFLEYMERETA